MPMNPRLLRPLARSGDSDVRNYIAAVESADQQSLEQGIKDAIRDFVVGCKADGIWNSIKASCILAGARTLTGALVPLKGPAPTNNGPFVSGDYDRKLGLKGNKSSKYLNTQFAANSVPQNDAHAAVYGSTLDTTNSGADVRIYLGAQNATVKGFGLFHLVSSGFFNCNISAAVNSSVAHTLGNGFFGVSRTASNVVTGRNNGTDRAFTTASVAPPSLNAFVFGVNVSGSLANPSDGRFQFYSIGTSINMTLLDSRLATLMTAIGAAI